MEPEIVAAIIGGVAAICAVVIGLYWQRRLAERGMSRLLVRCLELGHSVVRIEAEGRWIFLLGELTGVPLETPGLRDVIDSQRREARRVLFQECERAAALATTVGIEFPASAGSRPDDWIGLARQNAKAARSRLAGLPDPARSAFDAGGHIGRLHNAVIEAIHVEALATAAPEWASFVSRRDLVSVSRDALDHAEGALNEARLPRDSISAMRRIIEKDTTKSPDRDLDLGDVSVRLTRAFADLVRRLDRGDRSAGQAR